MDGDDYNDGYAGNGVAFDDHLPLMGQGQSDGFGAMVLDGGAPLRDVKRLRTSILEDEDLLAMNHKDNEDKLLQAIIVWCGMLVDGAPESIVLGLVSNTQPLSSVITLVVAVFLSNFPEALSSSNTMREHGM